ncbi:MAG: NADH-quinone oxidoreductase subunit C [Pirellulales bacterium]|nr:NADH-quinone oxidoreductase subunit C [Pirellulales bacterium]
MPTVTEDLKNRFPDSSSSVFREQTRIVVPPEVIYEVLAWLRDTWDFDMLVDITCVDYLNYRDAQDRFGMVYLLTNTKTNERLTVRTFLSESHLMVPSVVSLWPGANWLEREVWDLFGITFDGHPDHRRIVLPEEFSAHPLRKDYPLQGRGERHHLPVIARDDA